MLNIIVKSVYIIGFWIHNIRMNISLRNKVETYQMFRNMDFFDGKVARPHDLRVM